MSEHPSNVYETLLVNTLFSVMSDPVPGCLKALGRELGNLHEAKQNQIQLPEDNHAENLCNRFAHILFFANHVREAEAMPDRFAGSLLAQAYLTAFISSVKSFLDATALTLNHLYQLSLDGPQCDLSKGGFWSTLHNADKVAHRRMAVFQSWASHDVKSVRDPAIHSASPSVMVRIKGPIVITDGQWGVRSDQTDIVLGLHHNLSFTRSPSTLGASRPIYFETPVKMVDAWLQSCFSLLEAICSEFTLYLKDQIREATSNDAARTS